MTTRGTKRETRQRVLAILRAVPSEQRNADSATLRRALAPLLNSDTALNVAIFIPMPHEVNLLPLLQEYPHHHYAAPRCLPERQMIFHHIRNVESDTAPGAHGIPAPHADLAIMEAEDIDLLLIPGVAFTEQGDRLGYGGGYYDRFIPRCTKAQLVAPAFKEQMLPTLPTDAHDLRIPRIIHL